MPPPPPPSVEANYKPLVALVFAIILAAVGIWSSKRRPLKGGKERMAVMKAFSVTALPFMIVEATTGLVSYFTGLLSIPPIIGLGTALDTPIFVVGMFVLMAGTTARRSTKERIPGGTLGK